MIGKVALDRPGGHPGIAQLMLYILLMWMTIAEFPDAREGKNIKHSSISQFSLPPHCV